MRRLSILLTIAVALSAMPLSAHEAFRFVGTITKVQKSTFNMTTNEGEKISSLEIDGKTEITRDGKKVTASELKVGLSVAVDAYGDDFDGSLAQVIRIVPKITKTPVPVPAKKGR